MVKDIEAIETVQRHFTKWLPGFCSLSYAERLKRLNLPSLELRRLHADLIYCYKVVFGLTDLRPPPGAHLQDVSRSAVNLFMLLFDQTF